MGWFGCSRALRAVVLAGCIGLQGMATSLAADLSDLEEPVRSDNQSIGPFGLSAFLLSEGNLREKWQGLVRELDDELQTLARCDGDRTTCDSAAALQLLAIVDNAKSRDGRARLGEINRAINLAIKPLSDLVQYGAADVWTSPLATLARGAGDCEDYAIAKLVALRLAGILPEDVKLVIVRDAIRDEDHALVAARLDGRWLMLDNRRMTMVEDIQVTSYRPIFLIDAEGVKRFQDAIPLPAVDHVASLATARSGPETSPM